MVKGHIKVTERIQSYVISTDMCSPYQMGEKHHSLWVRHTQNNLENSSPYLETSHKSLTSAEGSTQYS